LDFESEEGVSKYLIPFLILERTAFDEVCHHLAAPARRWAQFGIFHQKQDQLAQRLDIALNRHFSGLLEFLKSVDLRAWLLTSRLFLCLGCLTLDLNSEQLSELVMLAYINFYSKSCLCPHDKDAICV